MKGLRLLAVSLFMSVMFSMSAFAATEGWVQNETGWWYQNADNTYPVSTWKWIDGNKDNVAECYYFNADGYLVTNAVVDNYTVNENGAWTIDGVVQTKAVVVYGEQTEERTETPNSNSILDEETLNNIPVRGANSGKGVWWS